MKKIIAIAISAISLLMMSTAVTAQQDVSVYIDGELLVSEYKPIIENDSTLIPMRDIFEALGAKIEWIDSEKTVVAYKGLTMLELTIGDMMMYVNGSVVELPVEAKLINDKTYIPLRAVSESLSAIVLWDEETRSVRITQPEQEHKTVRAYKETEIKAEDGNVILNICVDYPKFANPDEILSIDTLNNYYDAMGEGMVSYLEMMCKDFSSEVYNECIETGDEFSPLYAYFGYEKTYDNFNKLSFVEQAILSYKGEYTIIHFDSFNYDLTENRMIELNDILNVTEKDYEVLELYCFYLYEDSVICSLTTETIEMQNYGYEPFIGLTYNEETIQAFKYNPVTGETIEGNESLQLFYFNEESIDTEEVEEYNTVEAMNRAIGFKMAEFSDPDAYTPISYKIIDSFIGEIVYEDLSGYDVVVQKAEGDLILTSRPTENPVREKVIGDVSYVEFFEADDACYACFAIEKEDGVYSYYIETESKDISELDRLCKDIINIEKNR